MQIYVSRYKRGSKDLGKRCKGMELEPVDFGQCSACGVILPRGARFWRSKITDLKLCPECHLGSLAGLDAIASQEERDLFGQWAFWGENADSNEPSGIAGGNR